MRSKQSVDDQVAKEMRSSIGSDGSRTLAVLAAFALAVAGCVLGHRIPDGRPDVHANDAAVADISDTRDVPIIPMDVPRDEDLPETIVECGAPGQACCAGNTCTAGTAVCSGGRCVPCGSVGTPCCTDGRCTGSAICSGSVCVPCGSVGTPCCADGRCDSDRAICSGSMCVACGTEGIACCTGDSCMMGTCVGGICHASCGGPGQPCCGSDTCGSGMGCLAPSGGGAQLCLYCGAPGEPVCPGSSPCPRGGMRMNVGLTLDFCVDNTASDYTRGGRCEFLGTMQCARDDRCIADQNNANRGDPGHCARCGEIGRPVCRTPSGFSCMTGRPGGASSDYEWVCLAPLT